MLIYILLAIAVVAVIAGIVLLVMNKKNSETETESKAEYSSDPNRPERGNERIRLRKTMSVAAQNKGTFFGPVYIPTASGKPRCIDGVIIGINGIFFSHFIPMEGWLLGNDRSRWWTHFISTDERKYINNPVWETDAIIDELVAFLPQTQASDYRATVVFSNKCELRSLDLSSNTRVVNLRQLELSLDEQMMTEPSVFDHSMVNNLLKLFALLDDPFRINERLTAYQTELEVKRLDLLNRKRLQDIDLNEGGSSDYAEKQKLRENRHIRKHKDGEKFTRAEIALRDALVVWRKQQADAKGISIIDVFDNRTLDAIVAIKPKRVDVLSMVPGLDEKRIADYGSMIVTMVKHAPVQ